MIWHLVESVRPEDYGVLVVIAFGIFFYTHYHSVWANKMRSKSTSDDMPVGIPVFFAALAWAILLPVTLVYLLCMAADKAIKRSREHRAPPPEDVIRCVRCACKIATSSSFCSLCGAEQSPHVK